MRENARIELIENKGPNIMRDELREGFRSSSKVDIAVAFVNSKGLNLILSDLMRFLGKKNSRIRILTRISKDAFNEPAALRILLDLCKDFEKKCEVKTATLMGDFHQKTYVFANNNSAAIFVGSSNLTEKALEREGEMNVKIMLRCHDDFFKQVTADFDEYWNDADEISDERLDVYASFYNYVHSSEWDSRTRRLWKEVSGAMRKHVTKRTPPASEKKVWLDSVKGFLKASTEEAIKEYTSWDRFQYYSCGPEAYEKCNRNDVLVIADYNTSRLSANCIKSKTKTRTTSDGRHFVAYQKIRNSKCKKITRRLISKMKRSGMIEKAKELRPTSVRTLSGKKCEKFSEMLGF